MVRLHDDGDRRPEDQARQRLGVLGRRRPGPGRETLARGDGPKNGSGFQEQQPMSNDSNIPQQQPGFMPIPFYHPGMMQAPEFTVENVVPARVRLAAEFSFRMAQRTCPLIAVNDVGIQVEESPPLTKGESA